VAVVVEDGNPGALGRGGDEQVGEPDSTMVEGPEPRELEEDVLCTRPLTCTDRELGQYAELRANVREVLRVARARQQLDPDRWAGRDLTAAQDPLELALDAGIEVTTRPGTGVGELYGYSSCSQASRRNSSMSPM
jgi:hypothetical protein